ncbi:MAG: chorismate--pyruvate lyase [Clostridia bacterium]|nr:chorismate--pyruvate lyase [Clostridia bacterium]
MLWYVIVTKLEGDYAYLKNESQPDAEPYMVARFLLPDEIEEGTRLKCENLEYSLA